MRRWGVAPSAPVGWTPASPEALSESIESALRAGETWDVDCADYPCVAVGFSERVDPALEDALRRHHGAAAVRVQWLEAWVVENGERRSGFRFVATFLTTPVEDDDERLYLTRVGQALVDRHVARERAALLRRDEEAEPPGEEDAP